MRLFLDQVSNIRLRPSLREDIGATKEAEAIAAALNRGSAVVDRIFGLAGAAHKSGRWLILAFLACSAASPAQAQGVFGPGKFSIANSDDRFLTSGITTIVGRNNRLTKKSIVGGIYIDSHGLYLDPSAERSKDAGKIIRVGFVLRNDVQRTSNGGDANMLGAPREVSFFIDGTRLIKATLTGSDETSSGATTYTRMLGTASIEVSETATLTITPDEMAAIASAHDVAVHIEGSIRAWTCEARDVSKTFRPNLAAFYHQVVAATGGD